MSDKPGLTRRTMLASAGGAAGAVALVGVGSKSAFAASEDPTAGLISVPYTAGPITAGYSYRFYSGYSFIPHDSINTYLTSGGAFAFTGSTNDFATLPLDLPPGAALREVEAYGTRTGAGGITLSLWKTNGAAAPGLVQVGSGQSAGAANGQFTLALAVNETVLNDRAWSAFVLCGSYATLYGVRIGYTGPSQLYFLPTPVRVYDSRPGAGGTGPLGAGETRSISLAAGIPSGATGALLTFTLDNTAGAGYLQVFSAAATSTTSSAINWFQTGQVLANTVMTMVNTSQIKVVNGGPGTTNVLIDAVGYYQ